MPAFAGVDFIDFDSQLNDEEKLARQTARQTPPLVQEAARQ